MKPSPAWLLLSLLFAHPAQALYCGNYLIEPGQYKREVQHKCGDPDGIDTHIEKRAVALSAGLSQFNGNNNQLYPNSAVNIGGQQYLEVDVIVEEWHYNFGPSRFQQLFRFENGKLVDIKELGYGY
jgi:hypothetical protein